MRQASWLGPWVLLALLGPCAAARAGEAADPRDGLVPLPAQNGWEAQLCLDRGKVGVWTVKAYPVISAVGTEEIVALDDEGQMHILVPYSGRWSGPRVLSDGRWLGGLCHGDLDPATPGAELYTGGERGDLWQVVMHPHGAVEARLVAHLPGREIHTLVLGDLDPSQPGPEMAVFTWPGGLFLVRSDGTRLVVEKVRDLDARIRDAVVLPPPSGAQAPAIATVSRGGVLALLRLEGGRATFEEVLRVPGGMGRIARRPPRAGRAEVLYTVCDDGCVYRLERQDGAWRPELIYAGPTGMRGVVSGAFDADPDVETIAVFGYSRRVELLTRHAGGWSADTIFEDRDKGHWLCTAEIDNRNATPEIFCCGYGGRLVMLSRPAGYGRPGVAAVQPGSATRPPLRIGLAGVRRADGRLSPLEYVGGFRLKTLVFETLVGVDERGEPTPRLATRWSTSPDGLRWEFELREDARFHDGRACDAAAVAAWFGAWLGGEEHDWLRMNRLVTRVEALDARRVAFTLAQGFPLPQELASVNPCAVAAAPDSSAGTGPWRLERYDARSGARLVRVADGAPLEVDFLHGGDHVCRSHVEALASGAVDVVADGWVPHLPREEAVALAAKDPALELVRAPGSRTVFLACNARRPALAEASTRRGLAACLDPQALIRETQDGLAAPARGLFGHLPMQRPQPGAAEARGTPPAGPLALIVYENDPDQVRLALALRRQARAGGVDVAVEVLERGAMQERVQAGAWDLLLAGTHGRPYDPWVWLASRTDRPEGLEAAVAAGRALPTQAGREAALAAIEGQVAEDGRWIPLFVPDRIGLVRAARAAFAFGPTPYEIEVSPR